MRSNAKLVAAECQRRGTNATEVVPLCTGTWCFSISVRKSQWLMVRFGDDSTMWIAVLLTAVAVLFAIARVEAVAHSFPRHGFPRRRRSGSSGLQSRERRKSDERKRKPAVPALRLLRQDKRARHLVEPTLGIAPLFG